MEMLEKLPREIQIILAGTVLYLIMSFLNWQQVTVGPFTAGVTEWHGIGIIAALLAIALLAWEVTRVVGMKIEVGTLSPGLISVGLALLLALFTVITFLSHSAARHWPEWLGLILSIVIAVVAVRRARAEGVEMPKSISSATVDRGGSGPQD